MNIYIISAIISLVFIAICLYFFKKRELDFRYCILFMVLSAMLIFVSFNVGILEKASVLLGVKYAPALIFTVALIFVFFVLIYLAIFITNITKRITRLTQEVGILKQKLNEYEDNDNEIN